jgi:SecD/SecF fusion protein
MQTNNLGEVSHSVALDRAIEVLRTRVDNLGVAEPLIPTLGNNRILVQLPGLAEVDKQSARENIQKRRSLSSGWSIPTANNY